MKADTVQRPFSFKTIVQLEYLTGKLALYFYCPAILSSLPYDTPRIRAWSSVILFALQFNIKVKTVCCKLTIMTRLM